MSTTDRSKAVGPCICGKGTITLHQSGPDHPWVREKQIDKWVTIECEDCDKKFTFQKGYGDLPYLVKRVDSNEKENQKSKLIKLWYHS